MIYRVLAIVFIILVAISYSFYQKQSLQDLLKSTSGPESVLSRLPAVQFQTLKGENFDLEKFYREQKITLLVIHYWGTWCAPCEAELPDLLALIKKFEGRQDVKFLLVAVNDEAIKVQKHLKNLPLAFQNSAYWLLDNNDVHRDQFGTTRVPETYVFSSDKTTLRKFVGPQEWNKMVFFQTFDELLQISTHKL